MRDVKNKQSKRRHGLDEEAFYIITGHYLPMRRKARGLVQHGGPSSWQEESDPTECDFVSDRWPMPYRTVAAAAQLRADGISSCSKCTQPSVMTAVTNGRQGPALHG